MDAGQTAERAGEYSVLGSLCTVGEDDWCGRGQGQDANGRMEASFGMRRIDMLDGWV